MLGSDRDIGLDWFCATFEPQFERGAVVSMVAFLDHALGEALQARMIKDPEGVKRQMFSETGPLGSYGVRVRLGYLLGMFKHSTYRDFKIIGNIRNEFAHKSATVDFKSPRIQGLCSSLEYMQIIRALSKWCKTEPAVWKMVKDGKGTQTSFLDLIEECFNRGMDPAEPRVAFVLVCYLYSQFLLQERDNPQSHWGQRDFSGRRSRYIRSTVCFGVSSSSKQLSSSVTAASIIS